MLLVPLLYLVTALLGINALLLLIGVTMMFIGSLYHLFRRLRRHGSQR